MSLNKVMLIGNLGRDPESRTFSNGDKVTNLRIATSEAWKDKQSGERKEKTEWHSVAIFGPLADIAEKYLRKGSKVYLEGKLQTRKWQDAQGQDKYSTEIVLQGFGAKMDMLGDPAGGGDRDQGGGGGSSGGYGGADSRGRSSGSSGIGGGGFGGGGFSDDFDDDVPF